MKSWIKRHLAGSKTLYSTALSLNHKSITLLYYLLRVCPVNPRKVVFSNWGGNGYGDNPKYIAEEIIRQGLNLDMVWLMKREMMKKHQLPPQIRPVCTDSWLAIREMASARIWIDNSRKDDFVRKRSGQYYIQTWHSALPFKKIERDVENSLPPEYVRSAKADSRKVDLMLMGISQDAATFKHRFWYKGEVLNCGTPKLDIYFRNDPVNNEAIRQRLKVPSGKKLALYVPTFRKGHNLDVYNLDYAVCLEALTDRFGGDWAVLMRLHPDIMRKSGQIQVQDNVYNVTQYDDVQEIICISDIMITDYSGLMFEAAVKRMPCLLFASDLDKYMNDDRGSYFRLDELPFPLTHSNNELAEAIINYSEEKYQEKLSEFWYNHGVMQDGRASRQIVELIKKLTGLA